jgi:23S rRNA (adenine2030-N6)-methyltransferase
MLSYQHGYHAGNIADVHKHIGLVLLLRCLQQKSAPLCYVDCHAGRGTYDLRGEQARKTREADTGILRLVSAGDAPDAVRDYLDLVASFNRENDLRCYPGSAALAQTLLREQDRAILLELHPQEHRALKHSIGRDPRIGVHARDCYEGLPALLPPAIRRGLVLLDPSYEIKSEFEDVVTLLDTALHRWSNAVYLLWYPLLAGARERALLNALRKRTPPRMLNSEWRIEAKSEGLRGSGLVIINTPWQFEAPFRAALAFVQSVLQPGSGDHSLRWLTPP